MDREHVITSGLLYAKWTASTFYSVILNCAVGKVDVSGCKVTNAV